MKKFKIIVAAIIVIVLGIGGYIGWNYIKAKQNTNVEYDQVPAYSDAASVIMANNQPNFAKDEITDSYYEKFSELDSLGRCGVALACVGPESMPEGERGSIGQIKPSGWQLEKYDFIDNGGYIFNRCHLIGWQLTGQNDEVRNLITGTRYLNTEGMLPYENQIASYIYQTGNHVMYRVSPDFRGKELVARGVQLEAYSVEDRGKGLSFNVYCYNVQPNVEIDYLTGENHLAADADVEEITRIAAELHPESEESSEEKELYEIPDGVTYILNTNTMKFHRPDCQSVQDIQAHNREEFYGTRDEAIAAGYEPCGACKP